AFGKDNRMTYTYGSAAAHVAVDPGTGDVELLDCLVVEDVGRIVNPLTLQARVSLGQVHDGGQRDASLKPLWKVIKASPKSRSARAQKPARPGARAGVASELVYVRAVDGDRRHVLFVDYSLRRKQH